MKLTLRVWLSLLTAITIYGCAKQETDFRSFLNGKEVTYPGKVANVHSRPGNLRTAIIWNPSPDPTVTRYVVYWNNRADSIVYLSGNHNPSDTLQVIIPKLDEYIYSFTVYSYDNKGNRSVPLDINNVKVYGPIYQSGLVNRSYDATQPYVLSNNGDLRLNFLQADTAANNVLTTIRYTNKSNVVIEKSLKPDSMSILIHDYQLGTAIQYRSAYLPVKNALDTFYVAQFESFPGVEAICDKSLFREVHLDGDVGSYESGTSISKLWDGSVGPQSYPNIFHSDGNHPLPHAITFDMGKIYTGLSAIEETGRDMAHNPDDFEVWGIADITNAATTLAPNDPGWVAESQAKGWTLLKEVKRNDDGRAALKISLNANPPPVRYIRIRIKHVASGDGSYSNMSELTFFNKP